MSLSAGAIIDERFTLVELLGEGGFGQVWKATDNATSRPIALKLLLDPSADSHVRFRREARALAALKHPNCVTPYASGRCESSGRLYLAMELVEGRGLSDWIASRPPVHEVLDVASQLASALAAAHSAGITHRDVKPSNAMLTNDEPPRVKLIDFGIARFGEPQAGNDLTATGDVLGSPGYMSPEQMRGLRGVGPKSDLYSFGVLLFTALEGAPPFAASTALELCMQHLTSPAPPVQRSNCPTELATLVAALLEKAPDQRPDISRVLRVLDGLRGVEEPPPEHQPPGERTNRSYWPLVVGVILAIIVASVSLRPGVEAPVQTPTAAGSADGLLRAADSGEPIDHAAPSDVQADVALADSSADVVSGCGQPAHQSNDYHRVRVEGDEFHILLPKQYDPNRRYPALFLFQRSYYSQDEFFRRSGLKRRWKEGLEVILVTRNSAKDLTQNALHGGRIRPWTSVGQLRSAISAVSANYCVDEDRLIGVGHGKGAQDLMKFACEVDFGAVLLFSYAARTGTQMCPLPARTSSMRIVASKDRAAPREGGGGCRNVGADADKPPFISLTDMDRRWLEEVAQCGDEQRAWASEIDGTECVSRTCGEVSTYVRCMVEGGHNLRSPKDNPVSDDCDPDAFVGFQRFSRLVVEFLRRSEMLD